MMALPNLLKMTCNKCKISKNCPSFGSSPLIISNKPVATCSLIGGYGRSPIDKSILSQESLDLSTKNGDCLTIASVPQYDEASELVFFKTVKIFSQSVTHAREKTEIWQDNIIPKNHN